MSRALAVAIDLGVVMVMGGGVLLTVAGVRFVLSPVMFPPGLLWVVVSPRRRSVQDVMLLSVVVYDWRDDAGLQKAPGPAESPVTDGGRGLASGHRSRVADNGRNPR